LAQNPTIRLTKHARGKLGLMRRYGFEVDEEKIVEVIQNPSYLERRNGQYFATKAIDATHALRVVYEKGNGYLLVITFYPVRQERYGIYDQVRRRG